MNIFGFEVRRINPFVQEKTGFLNANFGGMVGRTPVNEKSVFGLSAYWAGVRRISESVAMLPVEPPRSDFWLNDDYPRIARTKSQQLRFF